MEDIDGEPVMDIDGPDAKNPLAVVEYVEELYAYYRRIEVIQNSMLSICFRFICLTIIR